MSELSSAPKCYRVCRWCRIPHIENCGGCFGFGVYPSGSGQLVAHRSQRGARWDVPAELAALLHEWMATRFTRPFNFGDIVAEIWHDYTCQLGDSIRLLQERGEWRSL